MHRATIEWSYDELSLKKQRIFERLSTFTAGYNVETAVAVLESFGAFAERRGRGVELNCGCGLQWEAAEIVRRRYRSRFGNRLDERCDAT
jgi:hypothetical protein